MDTQRQLEMVGNVEPTFMARIENPPPGDNRRWHSKWLYWKMQNGLAWRGSRPPNWKPEPKTFLAKVVCVLGRIK